MDWESRGLTSGPGSVGDCPVSRVCPCEVSCHSCVLQTCHSHHPAHERTRSRLWQGGGIERELFPPWIPLLILLRCQDS